MAGRTLHWPVCAHVLAALCAGCKRCMQGYGNLAALVNDPWVNPLGARQDGNGAAAPPEQLRPNCVVRVPSVQQLLFHVF